MILRCLIKEEGPFRLHFIAADSQKKMLRILEIGLPAGFQGVLFALSNVIIQASINSFGKDVMAGAAASANIENFTYFRDERLLPGGDFVYQSEYGRGQIEAHSQNRSDGNGPRGGDGLILAVSPVSLAGNFSAFILHRRSSSREGIKRLFLYRGAVFYLRHHGYDGRRDSRTRLFDSADDRRLLVPVCRANYLDSGFLLPAGFPLCRKTFMFPIR